MMFSIERPVTATLRPQAAAASMTCWMRWTFEANVVTIIRAILVRNCKRSIIKFQEKILKELTFFKRIFYNSVVPVGQTLFWRYDEWVRIMISNRAEAACGLLWHRIV